ncbi:MAG TPA: hypothetical protein VF170_01900 [Planctomycetaceae bacterium]
MVKRSDIYTDLRGRTIPLSDLDDEERALVDRLRERAAEGPEWNEFESYWWREVAKLYDGRGVPRSESSQSPVYRIAKDLGSRLAIDAGMAREPDYRDELADLIRRQFKTRREFCEATGLSEDMLSHVLARRKHLSIDALQQALSRIGCALRIAPIEPAKRPGRRVAG